MNEESGKTTLHGVLVSVDQTGVLITGDSGIGKSECALQLISRGHALVADDAVEIRIVGQRLVGSAPLSLRGLMEIRDVGIIDVVGLFGSSSFIPEAPVDAVVELCGLESDVSETVGTGFVSTEIVGVSLPKFRFVKGPTRDVALLIETVVKILKEPQFVRPLDSIKISI